MAIHVPIGSPPPTNRRHGTVFYSVGNRNLIRAATIPTVTQTNPLNISKNTFSAAAVNWLAIGSAARAAWNAVAISPVTGRTLAQGYWQLQGTWGYPLAPGPEGQPYSTNVIFVQCGYLSDGITGAVWIDYDPLVSQPYGYYIQIYLDYAYFQVQHVNGSSSSTPGWPKPWPAVKSLGAVFIGTLGPLPLTGPAYVNVGNLWQRVLGLQPQASAFNTTSGYSVGSQQMLSFYCTDSYGIILLDNIVDGALVPLTSNNGWGGLGIPPPDLTGGYVLMPASSFVPYAPSFT